ncbi:MAG: cytochrome c biogenesis protein CcsA [Crocinitomicaceae bacterium]|nr:cytochrome c biogenesis protein CcsA [Crocinitomicaceae bacterium]
MAHNVWKIGGFALITYVLVMVFVVPMGPGLLELRSTEGTFISEEMERPIPEYFLTGFATHWNEAPDQLSVIVRSQSNLVQLQVIEVLDDTHARIGVSLPYSLPSKSWDVLINHPVDGTLLLENGLFLSDRFIDESLTLPALAIEEFAADLPFHFPYQPRILETIRNLMLHVPMWFTMFVLMGIAFVASIKQLATSRSMVEDEKAEASVKAGLLFGILGLITGSVWARFTWGAWWVDDPQLNGALVTVLVYSGYIVLRNSIDNAPLRARLSAVYNLFAFIILIILLMVLPRFTESLHPGKGGNPGFNSYDLDSALRAAFYPAVIGWILIGIWMYRINLRFTRLNKLLK